MSRHQVATRAITAHWATALPSVPAFWGNVFPNAPSGRPFATNRFQFLLREPVAIIGDGKGRPRVNGNVFVSLMDSADRAEDRLYEVADQILDVYDGAHLTAAGTDGIDFNPGQVNSPPGLQTNQLWLMTLSLPFQFDQVS